MPSEFQVTEILEHKPVLGWGLNVHTASETEAASGLSTIHF